jgi:hypothetical protein
MNYFYKGNPVDWVHRWWAKARSLSPPWTRGGIDKRTPRRGGVCVGAQKLAGGGRE